MPSFGNILRPGMIRFVIKKEKRRLVIFCGNKLNNEKKSESQKEGNQHPFKEKSSVIPIFSQYEKDLPD